MVVLALGGFEDSPSATVPSGPGSRVTPVVALTANADLARSVPRAATATGGTATTSAPGSSADGGDQPLGLTIGDAPLEVLHDHRSFELVRTGDPGEFTATVTGMVLVDARGTDGGWRLQVKVLFPGHDTVPIRVQVTSIRAFARSLDGLSAEGGRVDAGTWTTVARSAPGNSAGSFAVTVEVTVTMTGDGPVNGLSPVHGTLVARAA